MDKRLYEFLKAKGCEFCYKDKEPFLLDCKVPHEFIEEYAELILTDYKLELDHIVTTEIVLTLNTCTKCKEQELKQFD